jgi:hypothetical protein
MILYELYAKDGSLDSKVSGEYIARNWKPEEVKAIYFAEYDRRMLTEPEIRQLCASGRLLNIDHQAAKEIAASLQYQGSTTLRVFSDGSWIAPATATQIDRGLESWDFAWTTHGYRPARSKRLA